jgi:hypothetical protein
MNTDVIKTLIYAERFYPFRIHHKKGRVYEVPDRDFAWVSPFGVYVVQEDATGRRVLEILNPALIERVTTHEEAETDGQN